MSFEPTDERSTMILPEGITEVGPDAYSVRLASGEVTRVNADDAYLLWMLSEKLWFDGEVRYRVGQAQSFEPSGKGPGPHETYDFGRLNRWGTEALGPLTEAEVDSLVEAAYAIRLDEGAELTLDQIMSRAGERLFDERQCHADDRSFSEMCASYGADERQARMAVLRDAAADWPCGPAAEEVVRSLGAAAERDPEPGTAGCPISPLDAMNIIEAYGLGELDSSDAGLYSEVELGDMMQQSSDPDAVRDAAVALAEAADRNVSEPVFRGDLGGFHVLGSAEEVADAMGASMDDVARNAALRDEEARCEPLASQARDAATTREPEAAASRAAGLDVRER